jgi:hypothetical protein
MMMMCQPDTNCLSQVDDVSTRLEHTKDIRSSTNTPTVGINKSVKINKRSYSRNRYKWKRYKE